MGCSNRTEGDKNGDVNGDHIVEESLNDMLNKADGIWRKRGGFVESVCVFDFGAIDGLRPGMGGILLESGVVMMEPFAVLCRFSLE